MTFANESSSDVSKAPSASASLVAKQEAAATLEGFSVFFGGENPESGEEIFLAHFTPDNELNSGAASQGLFGFVVRYGPRPGLGESRFVPRPSRSHERATAWCSWKI